MASPFGASLYINLFLFPQVNFAKLRNKWSGYNHTRTPVIEENPCRPSAKHTEPNNEAKGAIDFYYLCVTLLLSLQTHSHHQSHFLSLLPLCAADLL